MGSLVLKFGVLLGTVLLCGACQDGDRATPAIPTGVEDLAGGGDSSDRRHGVCHRRGFGKTRTRTGCIISPTRL